MKILIICTGNTCRSQMAEGFLRSFDPRMDVFSAGTKAESKVNPHAIKVMGEEGIDISLQQPEPVEKYLKDSFDYVITVCDGAKEICPVFTGKVKNRLHMGFEDPADAKGSPEEVLHVYRKVRDRIKEGFLGFYKKL
ncbi:MAG: arsenate reductase ArsC [Chlorobi bacterium]|nr:arsenate reductase ArsC [Chlorobiota bacterium]